MTVLVKFSFKVPISIPPNTELYSSVSTIYECFYHILLDLGEFLQFLEVKDFCATSAPFQGDPSSLTSTIKSTTTSTV